MNVCAHGNICCPDKQGKTLVINSGGRMSPDFHQVMYAFAWRKASAVFGPENVCDGDAEGDDDGTAERRRCIAQ